MADFIAPIICVLVPDNWTDITEDSTEVFIEEEDIIHKIPMRKTKYYWTLDNFANALLYPRKIYLLKNSAGQFIRRGRLGIRDSILDMLRVHVRNSGMVQQLLFRAKYLDQSNFRLGAFLAHAMGFGEDWV